MTPATRPPPLEHGIGSFSCMRLVTYYDSALRMAADDFRQRTQETERFLGSLRI